MQLAGTNSWRIATDEPQMLLLALYVRDASALRPQIEPDIPMCEPAVPVTESGRSAVDVASPQWADWWLHLLEGGGFWPDDRRPSDLSRLRHDPEIQRLFYWGWRYSPPDFDGLSNQPELRNLVREHFDPARIWSEGRREEFIAVESARRRRSIEWEVVQTVERGLGRKAHPFSFDIRVLPVAGVQAWRTSSGRALVSRGLHTDRDAYRDWLQPIVEELA